MTDEADPSTRSEHTDPGEYLDLPAVEEYLREHLSDPPDDPLTVKEFPSGSSNLTYFLQAGDWEGVLRRPPAGPHPPKAHDMGREFHVLEHLHPVFPLAPRPYLFCEDESVTGAPFYVMEPKEGVTLEGRLDVDERTGRRLSHEVVDHLAELHAVDYEEIGLGDFGHPTGYVQRQVEGWIDRWERAKTTEVPVVEDIVEWLEDNIPPPTQPSIVHNDYHLHNMLFSRQLDRMTALLDWELCTVGEPLLDLGVSVGYWIEPGDPDFIKERMVPVGDYPGFISRQEFWDRYARKSGREVGNFDFYLTFAYFRWGVVLQQIYLRWKQGNADDPRFADYDEFTIEILNYAAEQLRSD